MPPQDARTNGARHAPAARAVTPTLPPEVASTISVLVVDDDRTLREGCVSVLRLLGLTVAVAERGEDALALVRRRPFDIMLVDLYMSGVPGLQILEAALQTRRDTIVVMMTGNPGVESSIEARRLGAWDYLLKPFSATHLEVIVGRALHAILASREREAERQRLDREHGNSDKVTLLGISPAFRRAVELARRVAATDASVMITGESGTGKEVIAQFIHSHSRRAARALVPINCAAIPENLLESELFGHRKGAFTGADRDKRGLLEVASGGTLFLDELTDMPLALQAKLLRVIQDGVVRRVGSEQQDAVVDVRFISATNRDPQEAVDAGVLRKDLFYRLRVVPIEIPPLRERPEDIAMLAKLFLTRYWARHRSPAEPLPELSEDCLQALRARPWPGNVRELQNVIEHLAVLAQAGARIEAADVPMEESRRPAVPASAPERSLDDAYHTVKERVIGDFERQYLQRLLERAAGNMSRAARLARVDRTTLYRMLERQGLKRDGAEPAEEVGVPFEREVPVPTPGLDGGPSPLRA